MSIVALRDQPAAHAPAPEPSSFQRQFEEALEAAGCMSVAFAALTAWVTAEVRSKGAPAAAIQDICVAAREVIHQLKLGRHTTSSIADIVAAKIASEIAKRS